MTNFGATRGVQVASARGKIKRILRRSSGIGWRSYRKGRAM